MAIALETHGLAKSFRAGAGLCVASTHVLRHIDLVIHTGEAVGLLGPSGSGKSTLLLCLAGLLRPDAGSVRWFGECAHWRVLYHSTRTDLMRSGSGAEPHLHLVDVPGVGSAFDLDEWIELRGHAGDAVVVTGRRRSDFPPDIPVFSLAYGRLRRIGDERARVAEPIAGARC